MSKLIAVLLLASFAIPAAAADRCAGEGKLRSKNSRAATSVVFENKGAAATEIYWLDFKGKRVSYKSLAPGQSYAQPTYITHPWIAVSATGQCQGPFMPKRTAMTVTLN